MDRARHIAKVEDVVCWRNGLGMKGTLHLSAHHFIFRYEQPPTKEESTKSSTSSTSEESAVPATPKKPREMWITYPIISYCTYKPSPPASHQPPAIRIRCRDFTYMAFNFLTDKEARAVYDTIRSCTCKLGSLEKLLAFVYQGVPREKGINGWNIYDPRKEFARQGISAKSEDKGWRITEINKDYEYSPTYPAIMVVPSTISDNVLKYAKTYRSRARIPALTYLHPVNNASITRCSQPMVGVRGNRSAQDEKLVAAIWATNKPARMKELVSAPGTPRNSQSTSDLTEYSEKPPNETPREKQSVDNSGEAGESDLRNITESVLTESDELPRIYGAQQTNVIVDARPTVNAYAMQAMGMGTENMEFYKGATKEYFGIDNIHVMRKSLNEVIDMIKDSDFANFKLNTDKLERLNWLKHIGLLVDGGFRIAYQVGILHSHVLIHCSDGWDRTSQLSSLAQVCLDPYFRTIDGFITLVEKDWLSFGHMFRHRTGHLSSDKWFEIENERIANDRASMNGTQAGNNAGGSGGNPFENALSKAQGFFKKSDNASDDSDSDEPPYSLGSNKKLTSQGDKKYATKPKETSPMFHQFLDAAYQIMHQFPTRFEFNERFLRRLLYHVYACQYGTFLFDNERERVEWRAKERTRSVWDYFLSNREQFLNKEYDGGEVNDMVVGKERIILPDRNKTRWWAEMFGRSDEEMNAPPSSSLPLLGQTATSSNANPFIGPPVRGSDMDDPIRSSSTSRANTPRPSQQSQRQVQTQSPVPPVVTGAESADAAVGVGSTKHPQPAAIQNLAQQGQEALNAGLARLGIGRGSGNSSGHGSGSVDRGGSLSPNPGSGGERSRSPRTSKEVMEVEMQ